MSDLVFPISLSHLLKDHKRSFWNGDARLSFVAEELIEAIENNPTITLSGVRQTGRSLISTGIDASVPSKTVSLGDPTQLYAEFDFTAAVDFMLHLILSQSGLLALETGDPPNLKALLTEHIALSFKARLGVKGAVSAPFAPGLDVGMSFDTGGSYEWLYCRPARGNARVYEAVRATFAEARLPQTSLTRIASKGHAITLRPNEFIASRVTGFLNLGVEASFGYKMQGKASYELGAADLVTTLTMQARAYLKAGYQLAGAFQVVVTSAMDKPEWVRVTVEKDRHSTFDFGVGVAVNVAVATPGTDKGGLPLIEAILGATSGQVLRKALTYASLDASEPRRGLTASRKRSSRSGPARPSTGFRRLF